MVYAAWDSSGDKQAAVHALKGCTVLLLLTKLLDTEQREASQKMSERVDHMFRDAGKIIATSLGSTRTYSDGGRGC